MSITDFLNARIAEDEAMARAAIEPDQMHPYGDKKLPRVKVSDVPDEVRGYLGGSWGEHFARHDPARVLAECAAKRAILAAHEAYIKEAADQVGIALVGARVGQQVTGDTLRTLAAVYADHPAYRDEWRVGV